MAEGKKRHPDSDWFEVIGTLGRDDSCSFRIIDHTDGKPLYRPEARGELFAFANDLYSKYGNNRGCIRITVKREK